MDRQSKGEHAPIVVADGREMFASLRRDPQEGPDRLGTIGHGAVEPFLEMDEFAIGLAAARSVEEIAEIVSTVAGGALGARARLILSSDTPGNDTGVPRPSAQLGDAKHEEQRPTGTDAAAAVYRVPLIPLETGFLEFRFEEPQDLAPLQRLYMKAMALLSNQALLRVEELATTSQAVERLHRLEQMSGVGLLQMGLDELLAALPIRVAHALGCVTARIFLANDEGTELSEAGSHGLTEPSPARPFDQGLTGMVAVAQRGRIFDDISKEDVVGTLPTTVTTVAAVPLHSGGRVVGVLDVGASTSRRFGEDDLILLELAAERIATAIDRSRAFQAEQARRFRSEFLADLAQILDARRSPHAIGRAVARLAVERLGERCVVTFRPSPGDAPTRLVAERPNVGEGQPIVVTSESPNEQGPPASEQGAHWDEFALNGPTMDVGSIEIWRRRGRGPLNPSDLGLMREAASRIATTVEFRMIHDIQRTLAQELQRSLLPATLPEVPGAGVAVAYWSASEAQAVGGDFFDVFSVGPERWGVLIGDVSGKGVRAAAMTGIARHTARAASRHGLSPAEVLSWVHDAFLSEHETADSYCTAVFGFLSRDGKTLKFDFAVGGHPLPVLARSGHKSVPVGTTGTVLGLVDDVTLHDTTVTLAPGDTLVLYTDGVTDVPGELALYDDRLTNFFDELLADSSTAAAIAQTVETRLKDLYQDIPQDDTVVLVLQNIGPPDNRASEVCKEPHSEQGTAYGAEVPSPQGRASAPST